MAREIITEENEIIQWLMAGDPSIRWQTKRDLLDVTDDEFELERQQIVTTGWGKTLLSYQQADGKWGGGLYSPKWVSTTYTMLLLRRLGLPPSNKQAQKACALLLEKGFHKDGGVNFWRSYEYSETCVTGMILSILAYFQFLEKRVDQLIEHLLAQQMKDGGWNCQSYRGATHSSFHTTINVLEGLQEYQNVSSSYLQELLMAQHKAQEFLLVHKLYKSHRTGKIVNPAMTRFSFPPRWRYDVIRALDYYRECNAPIDERLKDAVDLLMKKRRSDGKWLLQNRYPGKTFFEMETPGESSRWNTLRALRILKWWNGDT